MRCHYYLSQRIFCDEPRTSKEAKAVMLSVPDFVLPAPADQLVAPFFSSLPRTLFLGTEQMQGHKSADVDSSAKFVYVVSDWVRSEDHIVSRKGAVRGHVVSTTGRLRAHS